MVSIADRAVAAVIARPAAAGLDSWPRQVRGVLSLYVSEVFAVQELVAWASHRVSERDDDWLIELAVLRGTESSCEVREIVERSLPEGITLPDLESAVSHSARIVVRLVLAGVLDPVDTAWYLHNKELVDAPDVQQLVGNDPPWPQLAEDPEVRSLIRALLDRSEPAAVEAPAHPAFAAHFTDPLYDDPAGEFAPFGTDEGADLLTIWAERAEQLADDPRVRTILATEIDDPTQMDEFLADLTSDEPADAAFTVVGAGFTLLRLTGTIDPEGRRWVIAALAALTRYYGPQRELHTMRTDIDTFDP